MLWSPLPLLLPGKGTRSRSTIPNLAPQSPPSLCLPSYISVNLYLSNFLSFGKQCSREWFRTRAAGGEREGFLPFSPPAQFLWTRKKHFLCILSLKKIWCNIRTLTTFISTPIHTHTLSLIYSIYLTYTHTHLTYIYIPLYNCYKLVKKPKVEPRKCSLLCQLKLELSS